MDILGGTPVEIVDNINTHYKQGLYAVNKREPLENVWEKWGQFCLDCKMALEVSIRQFPSSQHMKWIYALLQNRNQLISLKIKSRLGKQAMKRDLARSSLLMIDLILDKRKPATPCEICKKVDEHILKLSTGQFDVIVDREVRVSDYPEGFKYEAPAAILTPKPKGTEAE